MPQFVHSKNFRHDINGLRAWAVLAVVLYHFGVPGFSGGYVGVDIFFVISGYLMTGIVIAGLDGGNFSILGFYLARIKRIVPALLALCLLLLIAAWLLPLTALEHKMLGRHVRDSILFLSNVTYAREAGYFDLAAREKWLLHTWSLSIEWQFYLLLPIFLVIAKSYLKISRIGWFVLCLFLLSLTIFLASTNPSKAFYGLKYRAWEMLIGGAAVIFEYQLISLKKYRRIFGLAGFITLLLCVYLFEPTEAWPNWKTIFPVLAAALTIVARYENLWALANPISQWIGTRSYSIYLWHWPLVVAIELFGLQTEFTAGIFSIILTIIIGALSYQWIEEPARRKSIIFSKNKIWAISFGLILSIAGLGQLTNNFAQDWARFRLPAGALQIIDEASENRGQDRKCQQASDAGFLDCLYGSKPVKAIVIGDSHAAATAPAISNLLLDHSQGLQLLARSGCPIVFGVERNSIDESYNCSEFNEFVRKKVDNENTKTPLIIITRATKYPIGDLPGEGKHAGHALVEWDGSSTETPVVFLADYRSRFVETICHYSRHRPVYYVKPIPEFNTNIPNAMARQFMRFGEAEPSLSYSVEEYKKRHAFILDALEEARQRCGVHLLDPVPYLCPMDRCISSNKGLSLFSDNTHLSGYGNTIILPIFNEIFSK